MSILRKIYTFLIDIVETLLLAAAVFLVIYVFVFKAPNEPEKDFIKRVIATPGDKIYIKDGSVFLNGGELNENKYLNSQVKTYAGSFLKEGQEVTVPKENYLVMGDNRAYSSDSREWGFVPKKSIIGESFFVYWPPGKMGIVRSP